MAARPLDGVRVVEVGQLLAGPFAGTMLAYFGAIDSDSIWHPDSIKGARNHVRAALADMIAGRSLEVSKTRAYGCSVKYGS